MVHHAFSHSWCHNQHNREPDQNRISLQCCFGPTVRFGQPNHDESTFENKKKIDRLIKSKLWIIIANIIDTFPYLSTGKILHSTCTLKCIINQIIDIDRLIIDTRNCRRF